MANSTDKIRDLVDGFVADLTDLVREAALEAVQDALGSGAVAAPARRNKVSKAGTTKKRAGKRKAKSKGGKRIRRSADDLAAMGDAIVAHVKANPGSSMEELTTALDCEARQIRGPLNEMLAAKSLRKEGQKRGTRYFAGRKGKR